MFVLNRGDNAEWWKDDPFTEIARSAIRKCGVAKGSFQNLLAAGIKQPELLEFLVGRAVLVFHAQNSKPWYGGWESGRRRTPAGLSSAKARRIYESEYKKLSNLPQRLVTMANVIAGLNKRLAASGLLSGQIPGNGYIPTVGFGTLPDVLRRYAAFVARAASIGSSFDRRTALDELIQFVREQTGKPRLSDLSNVLDAVAREAGVNQDHIGTDALKARNYRKRKPSPPKK